MIGQNDDNERIAKKAHELWESEGRPHGRDQIHWDEAKEIVALEDSESSTLLPRDSGAEEPVEEKAVAIDNEGEFPNLTDTGEHDLTSIDREPTYAVKATVASPMPAGANIGAPEVPKPASAPTPAPKAVPKKVSSTGDAARSEKADKRPKASTKARASKK